MCEDTQTRIDEVCDDIARAVREGLKKLADRPLTGDEQHRFHLSFENLIKVMLDISDKRGVSWVCTGVETTFPVGGPIVVESVELVSSSLLERR